MQRDDIYTVMKYMIKTQLIYKSKWNNHKFDVENKKLKL